MRAVMRLGILVAAGMGAVPLLATQATGQKNQYFVGKVVPAADVKGKLTGTDAGHALVADDGKIYPLLKDGGAKMFAKDKRLLNRPMRLTARLDAKSNTLQVIYVHSFKNGKLHDIFYWCDICTIRGYENTICDCCGDPMVLKEEPIK